MRIKSLLQKIINTKWSKIMAIRNILQKIKFLKVLQIEYNYIL